MIDDVSHRITQPARRVHGDQHERRLAAGRVGETLVNVSRQDRLDLAIDFQFEDRRPRQVSLCSPGPVRGKQRQNTKDVEESNGPQGACP